MNDFPTALAGILIPLAGTTAGAAAVLFMKRDISGAVQKALLGFAAGVMIAASVFSLLLPAIEMAEGAGAAPWLPASLGFLTGVFFLLGLDALIPHPHLAPSATKGPRARLGRSPMLIFAVTLHNIPEGMAVGVVFAAAVSGEGTVTMAEAFTLAVGIAIQNFPEGAVISMPLKAGGLPRRKAFFCGFLSGVVEPAGALATIFLTSLITPVLPFILSFAAGAMIYVVVEELIPDAHSGFATVGAAIGFALMMTLDVALG